MAEVGQGDGRSVGGRQSLGGGMECGEGIRYINIYGIVLSTISLKKYRLQSQFLSTIRTHLNKNNCCRISIFCFILSSFFFEVVSGCPCSWNTFKYKNMLSLFLFCRKGKQQLATSKYSLNPAKIENYQPWQFSIHIKVYIVHNMNSYYLL